MWGCPQALLTAELAAAIPANGGPVVWVRRAFGPRASFVNGMLLVLNQVTDICLYPTLVAAYFQELFPSAVTDAGAYGIKLGALMITVGLNVIGIEALSASAALLTTIILAPFLVLPIVAGAEGKHFEWSALGPSGVAGDIRSSGNLPLFVSTLLWCMQVSFAFSLLFCFCGGEGRFVWLMIPLTPPSFFLTCPVAFLTTTTTTTTTSLSFPSRAGLGRNRLSSWRD
jgi:amino acid transporter